MIWKTCRTFSYLCVLYTFQLVSKKSAWWCLSQLTLISLFLHQAEVAEAQANVKAQKELLSGQNKEINAMTAKKEQIIKNSDEAQLEIKQLDHKLSKLKSEAKEAENRVWHWIFVPTRIDVFIEYAINLSSGTLAGFHNHWETF